MAEEFGVPFLGRAPIDPNFVLAIERNQGNQIDASADAENGEVPTSGSGTTIVDEYRQLALCDVFRGIVSKVVGAETAMQG